MADQHTESIALPTGVRSSLDRLSRQVVQQLCDRPGYRFLDEDDFAQRVYARACERYRDLDTTSQADDDAGRVASLAKNIYSEALCHGCRSEKVSEQQRAYEELGQYLYRIAYNLGQARGYSIEVAETCTQETLLKIHQNIGRVQQPGGFLGYAITTLNRECARTGRGAEAHEDIAEVAAILPDDSPPKRITVEMLDGLLDALARLPNKDWRVAMALQHFAGFGDGDIARVLGTSKGNVQLMRHRALQELREDAALLETLREM